MIKNHKNNEQREVAFPRNSSDIKGIFNFNNLSSPSTERGKYGSMKHIDSKLLCGMYSPEQSVFDLDLDNARNQNNEDNSSSPPKSKYRDIDNFIKSYK
mmetsp:Transcript_4920/g.4173  ORF Transcript_4920/g.4173 Transcript_4920/m.4173 type:complete len:99 (-) Transcript_4920:606-902(-)